MRLLRLDFLLLDAQDQVPQQQQQQTMSNSNSMNIRRKSKQARLVWQMIVPLFFYPNRMESNRFGLTPRISR